MKCRTSVCETDATHRVHWPSGPIDVCIVCAVRWGNIAHAMGMVLHTERLDVAALAATLMADDEDSRDPRTR